MINTFEQQSGKVSELRKTDDLCGKMYSSAFHDVIYEEDDEKGMGLLYTDDHVTAIFRTECIEVMHSESGELLWKAVGKLPEYENEFEFQSSLGLFHSKNDGEFGGTLITPKETLNGNFVRLFEFQGKVYAIDSLCHLGIGRTRIYEFDQDLNATLLYETQSRELLSLASVAIEDQRILILISGTDFGASGSFAGFQACSYLFEITKEGFRTAARFETEFAYVYNMLTNGDTLILGMDKVVAFADIHTKEICFYTPLRVEAEEDIRNTDTES